MADTVGRLVATAQNANLSPEDRKWASDQLVQLKTTKDRLMGAAQAGDPSDREWARGQLAQMGSMNPPSAMLRGMQTAPAISPTAEDEALGLDRGPQSADFNNLGQTHPFINDVMSRGGEHAQDRAALNDIDPATRKKMNAMVGGALASAAGGALLAPLAATGVAALPTALQGIGGLAGAGAVGGGSGYVQGTSQGLLEGKTLPQAHQEGVETGKIGMVLGAGGQMLGNTAGVVRDLFRRNPSIGGRAAAEAAGILDRPDVANSAKGAQGIEDVANNSVRKIIARDQELGAAAGKAYSDATEPLMSMPVDKQRLLTELEAGRASHFNPDTGQPLRRGVDARYLEEINKVKGVPANQDATTLLDAQGNPIASAVPGRPSTVAGSLAMRRALKADAGFTSANPTPEQEAAREAYQTYRKAVRGAAPAVGTADDAYAAYANKAGRRGDLMFGTEDAVIRGGGDLPEPPPIEAADAIAPAEAAQPKVRVGKEQRATTFLSRVGDENVPGVKAKRYIEELAAQDPEIAQAIAEIAAKKNLEATRVSLKGLMPMNLEGATSAAGFGPIVRQNARAIGYGAQSLADAGATLAPQLSLNPMVRAYQVQRERERMLADKLKSANRE